MFKIAKSSAKLNGDQIDIEIYVSPASSGSFTYDALYIGRWDDEAKEPLVMGEVDTDNNLEKFAFSVPAEKNGKEVIFVPRNQRTQKFSNSKIALKLPTLQPEVQILAINREPPLRLCRKGRKRKTVSQHKKQMVLYLACLMLKIYSDRTWREHRYCTVSESKCFRKVLLCRYLSGKQGG